MRAAELEQPSPIPRMGRWRSRRPEHSDRSLPSERLPSERSCGWRGLLLPWRSAPAAASCLPKQRLVPLLRRSFPGVDVRPRGIDDAAAFAEADVAAHYETIAFHYAKTADEMRRSLVPLQS